MNHLGKENSFSFQRTIHALNEGLKLIIRGGIIMEKNNITPISCYSDSLVYEELNKEELKEAGGVIDYVGDEIVDCDIYKDYDNKKRRSWFKYLMFLFLVLSFLIIVVIGSMRLSTKDHGVMEQLQGVYMVNEGSKNGV